MVELELALQIASQSSQLPSAQQLQQWANAGWVTSPAAAEITIRIVDQTESQQLNEAYRAKSGATNVLSFPSDLPDCVQKQLLMPLLGDLVICAPVVQNEAKLQKKTLFAHWAHMVVHGILHLQGYDHQTDADALIMENLEIKILKQLGFADPYGANNDP